MAALALGPSYLDQEVQDEQEALSLLLEPTRLQIAEIQLENSRRSVNYRDWAIRELPRHRQDYLASQDRVGDLLIVLQDLTQDINPELRVQVAELQDAGLAWGFNHQQVIQAEAIDSLARARFYDIYNDDRDLYDTVLEKQQQLLQSVSLEVGRVQGEVAAARVRRDEWAKVLVAIALFASLALGLVGLGTRRALREAHQRRRDAVWARRRTAAVLRATADGVIGVDLAGRATFVNPSGARILGTAASEVEGRSVHDILHGPTSDHEAPDCPWTAKAETPEAAEAAEAVDDWFVRANGNVFPVRASALPMIDGVEQRGAVLTFSDMTEIRLAEEALREAVRAREEVVSVVSHDLRNPVGTIFAAADLIQDADLDEDEVRTQATVIQRGARRMDRLIRDLLDVTRIEQGGFPVYLRPMAPSMLVREAEELLRPLVERNGIRLEVGVPPSLPRVSADTDRMLQVFSNLIGNAVRFTPPGGQISIVAVEGQDREVVFQVSDTGAGIRKEDQTHLFERYWTAGAGRKSGTGLGLAIVEGIVRAHGGRVWVESEPGEGARFLFVIPTAEKGRLHARSEVDAAASVPDGGSGVQQPASGEVAAYGGLAEGPRAAGSPGAPAAPGTES